MAEDVLVKGALWEGIAVELGVVPCDRGLGSRCVGPAAECGWGWLSVEVSWSACGAVCRQWGKEMPVVCTGAQEG